MENESDGLAGALTLLREQFKAHRRVGQDQFFGLRRRVIRYGKRLCSVIEWFNALGGSKGVLIRLGVAEEDAVVMVLHAELSNLRAALPRVLPKPFRAPARAPLVKRATSL